MAQTKKEPTKILTKNAPDGSQATDLSAQIMAPLSAAIERTFPDLQPDDLLVTMMGNFAIKQYDRDDSDIMLSNLGGRSRRLWLIIAYLILNRKRGVSASDLIEMLWPDVDAENPQTRLQNNISRTRNMLNNSFFDDAKNLIRFKDGLYWWAPDRRTVVDVDLFEHAVREMGTEIAPDQIDRALQICDFYQGDFLSQATEEGWCANLNVYYRSLFTSFATKVLVALRETDRLDDIKKLCIRVINIDPTIEEFNIALMKALIEEGNASKAIEHYEYVKNIYHDIYGVAASPELEMQQSIALESMYGNKFSKKAIISYLRDVDQNDGAFICNTVTFREIAQLLMRMMRRSNETSHLMAIEFEGEKSEKAMDLSIANITRLEHVLQSTLRAGDTITKMGRDVFLVLLPFASREDTIKIIKRIVNTYYKEYPASKVRFHTWQVDLKDL